MPNAKTRSRRPARLRLKPPRSKPASRQTKGGGESAERNARKVVLSGRPSGPKSKTAQMLALLRRLHGASVGELVKATDWLEASVRGALSGTVRKRLGLTLTSAKTGKIRRYKIVGGQQVAHTAEVPSHD